MSLFHNKKTFLKAAQTGDADEIRHCIDRCIPGKFGIDVQDDKGVTALVHAAGKGDLVIVRQLLAAGADPNMPSRDGDFPLMAALEKEDTNVALALIEAGARPDTHTPQYVYALHLAAFTGDLDCVKALVNAKADINAIIRNNGRTALHWALEKEFGGIVEFLAQSGARQDIADKNGRTAMDLAKSRPRLLKLLRAETAAPAAVPSAPVATGPKTAGIEAADSWHLAGANRVAHTGVYPELGRKITEIFNFESRERTVIAENLRTGAETLTTPESFDTVNEEALRKALAEFHSRGGAADEGFVLGPRGAKNAFKL